VSVTIATKWVDGQKIVQLYIRDLVASTTRPIKEVKGFKRLLLKHIVVIDVDFEINAELLGILWTRYTLLPSPGLLCLDIAPHSDTTNYQVFEIEWVSGVLQQFSLIDILLLFNVREKRERIYNSNKRYR